MNAFLVFCVKNTHLDKKRKKVFAKFYLGVYYMHLSRLGGLGILF